MLLLLFNVSFYGDKADLLSVVGWEAGGVPHPFAQAAALKKNLDRFVGVGLGTMLGQLVMGISCDISLDIGVLKMRRKRGRWVCG